MGQQMSGTNSKDRSQTSSDRWTMEKAGYLIAITQLFRALNESGVRYCHWKSNCNLDRSLGGLTDLDILVDRKQGEYFRLILHQHGIKPIASSAGRQFPGLEDYLGIDGDTGRMFHLHVHYQLVLGEQFVKNYRLPVEEVLLENTMLYAGLVKIPLPELEIILLAVRALLKYRDRDVIKDMLSIRTPGLPKAIRDELNHLFGQTDLESVSLALRLKLDLLPAAPISEFLSTVSRSPRSGHLFCRLRNQLRRDLIPYQRHSRWWARFEYWGVLLRQSLPFFPAPPSKKSPIAGGMMIAVMGADGAGKSTSVNELQNWLSWKLNVRRYYLGSQEPSRMSKAAQLTFRIARSAQVRWGRMVGEQHTSTKAVGGLQRLLHDVYHVLTARDRYRRYAAGRRQALQGTIVIFDRYPLEALHHVMPERPMDGPRIAIEVGENVGGLTRSMSEMEKNYYRRIRPPDHLFILHVSPQVSRQRKSDHDHNVIEEKSQALRQMDKKGLYLTEIDADQALEQVLFEIKTGLWELL